MTSKELIEALPIVGENILAEAALQPQYFISAARYRVDRMRDRMQAAARREYLAARLRLLVRSRRNAAGKKVSEGYLDEKIEVYPKHRELRLAVDQALLEEEFSKLILEAYRHRRDSIRIIAEAEQYEGSREGAELERLAARKDLVNRARDLEKRRRKLEPEAMDE
jgi:hypothetical protein